MSFPVACFSCNTRIGKYEIRFTQMQDDGYDNEEILNKLNIHRYCCRRMFLSYVELNEKLNLVPDTIVSHSDEKTKADV